MAFRRRGRGMRRGRGRSRGFVRRGRGRSFKKRGRKSLRPLRIGYRM